MRTLILFAGLVLLASPALAQRYNSAPIFGVGEGDRFGQQVAVGNLNGGASDVLIVSESGLAGGDSRLTDHDVHVFFGTSAFPTPGLTADDADLVLSDAETDAAFGHELAVGDFNDDGYSDVVVGVPYNNDRVDESGAAYIYCGGAPTDSGRDRVLYGRLTEDTNPEEPGIADAGFNLGQQVAVGDLNGDGFDDMVVGGFSSGEGGHEYHVFLGNAGVCSGPPIHAENSDATIRIEASAAEDVAVGDVNGDIYADIVIVDTDDWLLPSGGGRSGGALFTFHGAAALPALQTVSSVLSISNDADTVTLLFDPETASASSSATRFVPDVAVGDLSGDGVGDVAVAAVRDVEAGAQPYVHAFDGAALSELSIRDRGEFSTTYEPGGSLLPGESRESPMLAVEIGDAGGLTAASSADGQADLLVGGFSTDVTLSFGVPGVYRSAYEFGPIDFVTGRSARVLLAASPGTAETTAPVPIPSPGCAGTLVGFPSSGRPEISTAGRVSITACNPLFAYPNPPPGLGVDANSCDAPFLASGLGIGMCGTFHLELAPGLLPSGEPTPMQFGGVFRINPNSNDPQNPDYIDVSEFYDIERGPNGCSVPGCAVYTLNEVGVQNAAAFKEVVIEVTAPESEFVVSVVRIGYDGEALLVDAYPLTLTPPAPDVFGSYDLYAAIPGTSSPVRITSIPDRGEFNPAWAPFGPYVIHDGAAFGPGDVFLGQDLWITNAATGTSSMLPGTDGGNDADWWPFGALIAYDRAGDPAGPDETIYLSAAWGGARIPLRADALDPSWSPTGRYLAFQQPSDGSIRSRDLLTGREWIVAKAGQNPAWSPNGRWIAYSDGDDLFKISVRPDGRPLASPVAVTSGPEQDSQPAWYPFNGRLAYQSDASGAIDLYRVSASGGSPVFVTGLSDFGDFHPAVYPSQSGIVAYSGYTAQTIAARRAIEAEHQLEESTRSVADLYAEADLELADLTASIGLDASAGRQLDAWIAEIVGVADTEEAGDAVSAFAVSAYPNPASASATVRLELAEATEVEVTVVDVLGREVARLADRSFEAGRHSATWDVSDVPPGLYVVLVRAGEQQAMHRLTVAR
ncbi:MAG: hypothetical protein Rubg2KO_12630 [Rubricoccaceae bacterium]